MKYIDEIEHEYMFFKKNDITEFRTMKIARHSLVDLSVVEAPVV